MTEREVLEYVRLRWGYEDVGVMPFKIMRGKVMYNMRVSQKMKMPGDLSPVSVSFYGTIFKEDFFSEDRKRLDSVVKDIKDRFEKLLKSGRAYEAVEAVPTEQLNG